MSVSASLRVVRWTSRTPSRSSSCASLRLTVDFGKPELLGRAGEALGLDDLGEDDDVVEVHGGLATCYRFGAMSRYRELAAKVDGFFARVASAPRRRHAVQHGLLGLLPRAADGHARPRPAAIRDAGRGAGRRTSARALGGRTSARRSLRRARSPTGAAGSMTARPFVCRSHGAPIRMRAQSLPVVAVMLPQLHAARPRRTRTACSTRRRCRR